MISLSYKSGFVFLSVATMLLTGCKSEENTPVVWQSAPVIALLNGVYDGQATVSEIRKHGDQGLGTWDKLNGEGIILDGKFYQVLYDGTVKEANEDQIMPFAQVCFSEEETEINIPKGLNYQELQAFIEQKLPTANTYFALRLEGEFEELETRSLPEQQKPYVPFWEVQQEESHFYFTSINGTGIGFRSPDYMGNISPAGYHFHFLSDKRDAGGHVLNLKTGNLKLYIQRLNQFAAIYPTSKEFDNADLDSIASPN